MSREDHVLRVKWAAIGALMAIIFIFTNQYVEIEGDYRLYDHPYKNWIEAAASMAIFTTMAMVYYTGALLYRLLKKRAADSVGGGEIP